MRSRKLLPPPTARRVSFADIKREGEMAKTYKLLVLTNAVEGKDRQFNDWYNSRHLQDVLAVPGFVSAQRFELISEVVAKPVPYRYCATYDLETDNPQTVIEEMLRRVGTDRMPMSDAMDISSSYAVLYEPITPLAIATRL